MLYRGNIAGFPRPFRAKGFLLRNRAGNRRHNAILRSYFDGIVVLDIINPIRAAVGIKTLVGNTILTPEKKLAALIRIDVYITQ